MLAIIGRKNSGKTTLLVKLAAELHRRGHRVMTIKHGAHTFNIDPATTDTYRHYHEGHAERVAMVSPDKFALVSRWNEEVAADEVAATYMSDADVVLCEGFKASALRKVEIHRREIHEAPLWEEDSDRAQHYAAIVTDDPGLQTSVRTFQLQSPGWLEGLATLVETDIMGR